MGKASLALRASKRLSRTRVPITENALVGVAMPLRCCAPRSASSNCSPRSVRVVSLITTRPGAANACKRAALSIIQALTGLKTPNGKTLAARIGIGTGLVVVGDLIGEGASQEEAVVGETPNLAAR